MYRWDKQVVGHGPLFLNVFAVLHEMSSLLDEGKLVTSTLQAWILMKMPTYWSLQVFNHLMQKTQEIFYEARKFKTRQYQYSGTKNSSVHLKKNTESTAIKVMDINVLVQLYNQESQWTYKATLLLTVNISGKVSMTHKTIN